MRLRLAVIILTLLISVNCFAAQKTLDSAATYSKATMTEVTPQEVFQAADDNFDEIYGAISNIKGYQLLPIAWFSDGSVPPASIDSASTRPPWAYRNFDGISVNEDLRAVWQIPQDCVISGGFFFRVHYLITNATGPSSEGVVFALKGASIGDNDPTNPTLGTPVIIEDLGITAAQWDLLTTDWSTAVTFTDMAQGEFVEISFYREQSNTSDTYSQDVGVAFIEIQYTRGY